MISPETFLAWSEGAQLWDTDILHQESRSREPEKPVRMRPSTPLQLLEKGCPDESTDSRSLLAYEEQYDQEDGERMSPYYKVPSNPSILWESRREFFLQFECYLPKLCKMLEDVLLT